MKLENVNYLFILINLTLLTCKMSGGHYFFNVIRGSTGLIKIYVLLPLSIVTPQIKLKKVRFRIFLVRAKLLCYVICEDLLFKRSWHFLKVGKKRLLCVVMPEVKRSKYCSFLQKHKNIYYIAHIYWIRSIS